MSFKTEQSSNSNRENIIRIWMHSLCRQLFLSAEAYLALNYPLYLFLTSVKSHLQLCWIWSLLEIIAREKNELFGNDEGKENKLPKYRGELFSYTIYYLKLVQERNADGGLLLQHSTVLSVEWFLSCSALDLQQ